MDFCVLECRGYCGKLFLCEIESSHFIIHLLPKQAALKLCGSNNNNNNNNNNSSSSSSSSSNKDMLGS